jgi:hypothetical protein
MFRDFRKSGAPGPYTLKLLASCHQIGRTNTNSEREYTQVLSYQPATEASLNPTMQELLRANGQLRVELACKDEISRLMRNVLGKA